MRLNINVRTEIKKVFSHTKNLFSEKKNQLLDNLTNRALKRNTYNVLTLTSEHRKYILVIIIY